MRIKIVTGGGWCSCDCDLFSGCPFKTDTTGVPPNSPGPDCLGDGDYEVIAEHELAAMREVIRAHELRKRLDAFVQDYGRVNRD